MAFGDLAPSEQLLIARRGNSYFARHLAGLSDADLDGATLLAGWTRRHLLAHIGYNAAALCRLLDWAATGVETPMYESTEQRAREIEDGATLSGAALRNLFDHTAARLDEKWRHLPASSWEADVRTAQGRVVPVSETVWLRTREVWIHAVDLNNGARFGDFPDTVAESLLADIVGMWRKNGSGDGLVVQAAGTAPVSAGDGPAQNVVSGPLPSIVCLAAGRGAIGLDGQSPEAPPWL